MCLIRLLMSFLMHQGRARPTLWWANRRGICVCVWCLRTSVYTCYATCRCAQMTCQWLIYGLICMQRREIAEDGEGGREGERKDGVVRAWFKERLMCLHVWLLAYHRGCSPAIGCSTMSGQITEGEERIWDAALSVKHLQPRGPQKQGHWLSNKGHADAGVHLQESCELLLHWKYD